MIEESLLKSSFIGRDGYRWFLGQVPPNVSPSQDTWGERVPVRIFGYHTEDGAILPNEDLPLALISKPTTAGSDNRQSSTIVGSEFVLGFFLDGDDAQQPVITGVIERNVVSTTEISSIDATTNKSTGFKSTNYYGSNRPAWRVATQNKNPDPESITDENGLTPPSPGKPISSNDAGDESGATVPSALSNYEIETLDREVPGPSNCGDTIVDRIQVELTKLTKILEGVKKYYSLYVVGTINKIQDITGQIRSIIRNIAAVARTLIQRLRNFILKQIRETISGILDGILGDVAKDIKDSVLAKVLEILFCIFQTTIEQLPGIIGDFIAGIIGKFSSTPICAAEQFLNALINQLASLIDDAIASVADQISEITDGILSVAGNVLSAIDSVIGLLGFLCLTKKCTEVDKFSASPWAGPLKTQKDGYEAFLSSINVPDPTGSITQWLDGAGFTLDNQFGGLCNNGPVQCGPPTIDLFGGGLPQIEAAASAVVSNAGQIIGALITNQGFGYSSPPFVTFNDVCGNGTGAYGYAKIDDEGRVTDIIIGNPGYGYLTNGDGSVNTDPIIIDPGQLPGISTSIFTGPDGEVFTYPTPVYPQPGDFPPDGGGNVVSGIGRTDIQSGGNPSGGSDYLVPGVRPDGPISIDIGDGIDYPYGPEGPGSGRTDTGTPQPTILPDSDSKIPTTPVIGCLNSITVLSTGFGYSDQDEIVTIPKVPGLELIGQYTEFGQLVNVVIRGRTCGFTGIPAIRINSKTGAGVDLRAQLAFYNVNDFDDLPEAIRDQEFEPLQIIQCVLQ